MSVPVVFQPEATQDARDRYEAQQAGLGQGFLDRVAEAVRTIESLPELYGVIWQDVRACPLKRFPFLLYYRVLPQQVEVLAVLHTSRDPSTWQSRI